ncbi:MAG: BatD family protein [Planctomycetota bacterium]|jgi:hypothetical protein
MRISYVLMLVMLISSVALGQEGRVELQIPKRKLQVGESITLKLICHDMEKPSTPAAAIPSGLELKLANSIPSSNFTFINGVQTSSYTYTLFLSATKVGRHELGPITVTAGGQEFATRPVMVTVEDAHQGGDRGDRYLFGEVDVDRRSVYVTQSLVATLTIGIREVRIDGRRQELNYLSDVLNVRQSELSVFAGGKVESSTMTLRDSSGRAHRYMVYTVTKEIRAEEVGTLDIGPVRLSADYPTQVRRNFFRTRVTRARPEFAQVDKIRVDVKSPPDEGRPAEFNGALGRYKLAVSAKPNRVEQGKPVTIAISITGTPLDGVAGPELSANPELISRFDFTNEELIGDVQGRRKVFRRAIFPRQVGEQVIPPIRWSYFDPDKEAYVTLASKPINITVDPPSGDAVAINLSDGNGGARDTSLVELTGGISPNYVEVESLLASQELTLSTAQWAGLIGTPLVWLSLTLATVRTRKYSANRGLARRRRAMRSAEAALRAAAALPKGTAQWTAIGEAFKGYLADRFNLPPGEITPADASALLNGTAATGLAQDIADFLESCNAVVYAPTEAMEEPVDQTIARVRGWMRDIEKIRH